MTLVTLAPVSTLTACGYIGYERFSSSSSDDAALNSPDSLENDLGPEATTTDGAETLAPIPVTDLTTRLLDRCGETIALDGPPIGASQVTTSVAAVGGRVAVGWFVEGAGLDFVIQWYDPTLSVPYASQVYAVNSDASGQDLYLMPFQEGVLVVGSSDSRDVAHSPFLASVDTSGALRGNVQLLDALYGAAHYPALAGDRVFIAARPKAEAPNNFVALWVGNAASLQQLDLEVAEPAPDPDNDASNQPHLVVDGDTVHIVHRVNDSDGADARKTCNYNAYTISSGELSATADIGPINSSWLPCYDPAFEQVSATRRLVAWNHGGDIWTAPYDGGMTRLAVPTQVTSSADIPHGGWHAELFARSWGAVMYFNGRRGDLVGTPAQESGTHRVRLSPDGLPLGASERIGDGRFGEALMLPSGVELAIQHTAQGASLKVTCGDPE